MQQAVNTKPDGVLNFVSQVVENASEFPSELMGEAENINNELIAFSKKLENQKQQTAKTVEKNLTKAKIQSTGARAASWLSQPVNLVISVLAVILILVGVRNL